MTGDPMEILLVEDNPAHAEMTVRALRKNNVSNHIRVARDGAEAVNFLFANGTAPTGSPKLILLDLKLPKLDGIEVLRRIKADPRTKMIPVVMLTSSNEDHDLKACYGLGVNSYIVKPVDFQQFSDAVRSLGLYWVLLNRLPNG
ncbi:MAG TPA: response regulator [bacterium]|nr:response regulator [bacterium]